MWKTNIKGFHVGDARVKILTPASKMCDRSPLGVKLNFDARVKNSDAAQPRVTNVKTPIAFLQLVVSATFGQETLTSAKLDFSGPSSPDPRCFLLRNSG